MVQPDPDQVIEPPQIELRLTGPWRTPEELAAALEKKESEYELKAPGVLVHRATGWECECGGSNPDDQIADIFAESGRLSVKELREIDDHAAKVHLLGEAVNETASAMMNAAAAIIRAGASGVMVDNSGNAHGRKDFLKLAEDKQPGGLYWFYVAATGDENDIYSTGMHCLGFRDAELLDAPSRDIGGFIVHNFNGFCYQSGRTVREADAIGGGPNADLPPRFRLKGIPCERFEKGTAFHNPYGLWRMMSIEE